jgi:hypothetical protein
MSGEILSGIIGGIFGPVFGKVLGRFSLWKVFVACLFLIYLAVFLVGAFYVGGRQSFVELGQFLRLRPFLIFAGISAGATLVAFLGRSAKDSQRQDDVGNSE